MQSAIVLLIESYYSQGNGNYLLIQAMKLSFIEEVDCSVQASGNSCLRLYINRIVVLMVILFFLLLGTDGEIEDFSSTINEGKKKEIQSDRFCLQSKMKSIYVYSYTIFVY